MSMNLSAITRLACLAVMLTGSAFAGTDRNSEEGGLSYGSKGLQFESADGNNFLWFGVRLQSLNGSVFAPVNGSPSSIASALIHRVRSNSRIAQ